MHPLNFKLEDGGAVYGAWIEYEPGDNLERVRRVVNRSYKCTVEALAEKGLVPVGRRQIVEHRNADEVGPYPTMGWKQTFRGKHDISASTL